MKNKDFSQLNTLDGIMLAKSIVKICWHFNIYKQDKFQAQLSWAWKKVLLHWVLTETQTAKLKLITKLQ